MVDQAELDKEEAFSWKKYREERRKKEKNERRRKKESSKESMTKTKGIKTGGENNSSFNLLDVSDRTEPTMAESESTLCSLAGQATSPTAAYPAIDLQQDNVLDHVVLAAPDLETAITEFEKKTGVKPVKTGYFKGLGITKARIAFHGSSFLEIIAPDPEREGPIGTLLKSAGLTELVPFHWAIRLSDAEALASEVTQWGYTPDFVRMSGPSSDGICKQWEMLYLYGHALGGLCPFFIHWNTFDHPCETLPVVGNLIDVRVTAPKGDSIHKLLAHTGSTGFAVLEEDSSSFEVKFDSPRGEICFAANQMAGFKIPGFENVATTVPVVDNSTNTIDKDENSLIAAKSTKTKGNKTSTLVKKDPKEAQSNRKKSEKDNEAKDKKELQLVEKATKEKKESRLEKAKLTEEEVHRAPETKKVVSFSADAFGDKSKHRSSSLVEEPISVNKSAAIAPTDEEWTKPILMDPA